MKKLTHKQVMASLKRLEKGWPNDLWIWAGEGGILLMKKDENGNHAYTNSFDGAVDQDYVIEQYSGIDNDGGGL